MIFDLAIVVIFIYIGIIGFRRGVWLSTIHLSATIFALWVAQKYYLQIAQRLELFVPYPKTRAYDMNFAFQFADLQQRFEHIVAFVTIALITKVICYGIIVIFDYTLKQKLPNITSRLFGMMLSIIPSVTINIILLYSCAIYPNRMIQQQLSNSIITEHILLHIPFISMFITQL
ncbi:MULTISPECIES: CvpA family protein [Staphylococcus]|uniref:CvpA family protein n=1 Tax=Staphylococcus TaxID=1279 RepID=UPI000D1BE9EC|nr:MULTISPECIES: CvpA family protein [Staphylococcus]PTG46827.1 colicin V production protein CvpA [Staphylococcus cohnii]MDQ7110126.1 CvpA family protein [Staphylococcus ureilyticus]MDU9350052.1 CvpA family protein [Staphylococcus ureilyticus]QQV52117.1 CvpA family protein [Staphylococcus sp. 11-B-312]RIL84075.1 CvpA family protein [Staphylococcus cohnii]